MTTIAERNGNQLKAYVVEGGSNGKAINLAALTQYDIDRWFRGTAPKGMNPHTYYQRVGVFFRCTEMRAQTLAHMPRQIVDRETGELLATANFPTPQVDDNGRPLTEENLPFDIDLTDLLWRSELSQVLLASTYWQALKNRVIVKEVRWLDPRTITPKFCKVHGLSHFERQISAAAPQKIKVEDMAYIWRPGLQELGTGTAPGQVAAREAGIHDNMDTFIEAFFERGAMPTTLVFAESQPNPNEKTRIKKYLERVLTGLGNAFGIEVLNAALKFETLTPPLKELLLPDIKDGAQRGIASTLGVPASLIFAKASNFATAQIDDLNFYTKTVNPESSFIEQRLNKTFFNALGLILQFRPDQLEIFQQRELKKVNQAIQLYDRDAIDEDELRQAGGFAPREDGKNGTAVPDTPPDDENEGEGKRAFVDRTAVARQKELKRWRNKVLKQYGKRPPYAIPFEPKHLTAGETAVVRQALLNASSYEEVKAAFAAPFRVQSQRYAPRGQHRPGKVGASGGG